MRCLGADVEADPARGGAGEGELPERAALAFETKEIPQGTFASNPEGEVEDGGAAGAPEATQVGRHQRAEVGRPLSGRARVEATGGDGGELESGHGPTVEPYHGTGVNAERRQSEPLGSVPVVARSISLFVLAAVCEIGGAWLIWQAVKEGGAWWWGVVGGAALVAYGFVAALQPDAEFGRVLAAYGGVFVAGSLLWAMALDGFRPDRYDLIGAAICLVGVGVIMYARG